jgi:hypothetical protein
MSGAYDPNVPPVGQGTGNGTHRPGRILTGAAFIADHVPPVWLIDGIVQRSRLYACTSLTGHGKTAVWLYIACMIHADRMIGTLDAFDGNVLILAGERRARRSRASVRRPPRASWGNSPAARRATDRVVCCMPWPCRSCGPSDRTG